MTALFMVIAVQTSARHALTALKNLSKPLSRKLRRKARANLIVAS
eukprot:CAMPEP_0117770970 /NCGR_PEP_ID=MMETSP0947-20121206/24164_1 /TAXON_ID=44440 /ORGANISM="Chattonella subsalsa, Strain CCMP2191" /LENGTH=44 /DNA_ID= /DNA_START= /DNA_END= /DNA_ORIENTATION=